jgi:hypothetical protein
MAYYLCTKSVLMSLTFNESLLFRLLINLAAMFCLVRLIYYRIYKKDEFIFSFVIFNVIIFLITFILNQFDMSMGAAFGLFAVFSMLRYRTENISIKDMTYLFLVIALGLVNSVMKAPYVEIILVNLIILGLTLFLESRWVMKRESSAFMVYNNLELITPEKRNELIADLCLRTGLKVYRVELEKIDYLKQTVQIRLYYRDL